MLHKRGTERLPLTSDAALATRTPDGKLVIALWNYAPPIGTGPTYTMPSGPAGPVKSFDLQLDHVSKNAAVKMWRVDADHGNVLKAFDAMSRPPGSLTPDQVSRLKTAGAMAPPESLRLANGNMKVSVPAQGLVLLVVSK